MNYDARLPNRLIEGSTVLDFQYFQVILRLFGLFITKERLLIAVEKIEGPRLAVFFRDKARE